MADLIDRETVRLAYEKSLENDNHRIAGASAIHMQEHRHILHILDKIPTINPESLRPQGKWMYDPYNSHQYCSHCRKEPDNRGRKTPYCPNCGADMRDNSTCSKKEQVRLK